MSLSKTTGPEGSAESAVVFNGTSYLTNKNRVSYPGEFTVLFWVKSVNFLVHMIQPVASIIGLLPSERLDIYFNDSDTLSVGNCDTAISSLGSEWMLYSIVRDSDDTLHVYEGVNEVGSFYDFSGLFGGLSIQIGSIDGSYSSNMTVSGVKVVPRAYSQADIAFHFNDTLNNAGKVTWP